VKQRYWLWKRDGVYYLDDELTRKKESRKTSDREEAEKIREVRNAALKSLFVV